MRQASLCVRGIEEEDDDDDDVDLGAVRARRTT